MQSNHRLDDLAYNLIRLLSSEDAYHELTTFAAYQARAEKPVDTSDADYFERQASAMEQSATALIGAKDRVIAEYNQRIKADQETHENLFPWHGLRNGVQA